jgi:sugar/nucleoside kinase (ribokinase family)
MSFKDLIQRPDRSKTRFDIAVLGELNLDLVLYGLPRELPEERELLASDFTLTLGSSSGITAHNLAVLGNKVAFVSMTGNDSLGGICRQRLQQVGVSLEGIATCKSGQGTGVTLLLPLPGTTARRILTYPGAMFEMSHDDIDEAYLASASHFHLSAFFMHRKLIPDIPALFARMKALGLTTSLDTNDDPEDEWGDPLLRTLPSVDILLCNEREVRKIAQCEDTFEAVRKLAQTVPLIVVKCGASGARAIYRGQELFASGNRVDTVDAIGAGDSFNAGFLHRWLRGGDLEACLKFGNLTGALSTTRRGGTEAFRDQAYLEQFLRGHWAKAENESAAENQEQKVGAHIEG